MRHHGNQTAVVCFRADPLRCSRRRFGMIDCSAVSATFSSRFLPLDSRVGLSGLYACHKDFSSVRQLSVTWAKKNRLGIPATAVTNRQGLLIRLLITLRPRVSHIAIRSAGYSVLYFCGCCRCCWLKCCFTSTETVDLLGTGALDVHLRTFTQFLSSVLFGFSLSFYGPSDIWFVLCLDRVDL